ncbi:hypothetical protein V7094_25935 [Priestia megaterium]|uniref:phage head spike fiber domain-containing protein n=1 Tax=Priestia megaterium TaxID=1404 RepID=UPI0030003510
MTILGLNKEAIKSPKKNLLPPFEDTGWIMGTGVNDVEFEGYNISFSTDKYQASVYYNIPHDLVAGKTITVSTIDRSAPPTKIQLNIYDGVSWSYVGADVSNYFTTSVPANAQIVQFRIQNQLSSGVSYHYVTGLQAEIGSVPTEFEERQDVNKEKKGVPTKNLASNIQTDWSIRASTNWFTLKDNVLTYEATAQYAGANLIDFNNYIDLRGKTVTMSYESATANNTLMFYYMKSDGSQTYIGVDGTTKSRTIPVPTDASFIRLYIQNTEVITAPKIYTIKNIQLEIGDSATTFTPYSLVAQPAKMISGKNIFNVNGGEWKNKTGSGTLGTKTLNEYAVDNLVRIAGVFPNKIPDGNRKYFLSWNDVKFNIAIWEIDVNGMVIADFGWKNTSQSYTFKSNAKSFAVVVSHKSSDNISVDEYKELNLQVEEGTVKTSYEDFGLINRPSKTLSLQKASFKNYPFNFTRDGSITYGNKLVSRNQPRINGDGVLVEDATVNLASNAKWNQYTIEDDGDDIVDGINARKFTTYRTDNTNHRACKYIEATVGKTYSASCLVKYSGAGTITISSNKPYPEGNNTISVSETGRVISLGNDWYRVELVSKITSNTVPNCILTVGVYGSSVVLGESFWIADFQWEAKGYPTSYCDSSRSKENLAITNAGQYIDTQKGSIELEFTPLTEDNTLLGSETWGAHDMTTYIAGVGGFIVRRSYSKANRVELVVVNQVNQAVQIYNDSVGWKNGDSMKYRLEWDAVANTSKLIVNDTYTITAPVCFKMFDPSYIHSLTVGSRGLVTEGYGCGNAIYKSIVIRNRNGETTYRF